MLQGSSVTRAAGRVFKDVPCPEFREASVRQVTLRNGFQCFVLTGPGISRYFGLVFPTPATSSKGTQHVLEHMVLDGSKNYPAASFFSSLHAASDISLGAWTWSNRTAYHASALSEGGLVGAAQALIDCTTNPILSRAHLKAESSRQLKERTNNGALVSYQGGIVYNELAQGVQHPRSMAVRNAIKAFFPEFLPEVDFAGDLDGLKQLRYSDVVDYHRRFYFFKHAMGFVAHPTSAEPILDLLENVRITDQRHGFQHPVVDLAKRIRHAHADVSPSVVTHVTDSSMVLIYPIARPKNLTELIYLDAMHSALFYLHDNRFTEAHGRASFTGSPTIVSCTYQPLGTQHFLVIQADGLDPRDFDQMRRLISESYGGSDSSPLSRSTLEAALLSTRHRYFDGADSPVNHVFSQLAYNWNTSVGPAVLQQGTLARYLEGRVDEAYPDFCSFVGRIFRQEPFVFTQTPSSKAPRRRSPANQEAAAATSVPPGLVAPLVVPSYNLTLHRVIKSSADAFTVRYPFKDEGLGAIVSTPVGDENRIHLNIGFDLTRLSPDLWLHALALLNTLEANSAHFAEEGKTAREIYSLSSSLTSRVVPVSDDGCHFFVSTSLFPEDLAPFLDFLGTLFQNIHFQANSYLYGLDTQRNSLFSDIYNPAADDALDNAFVTRGLAGLNTGFLHREALVGLASLSRYNRILSAVSNKTFSESERRQHAAANWLFASSSLLLQYSAPRELEEVAGRRLRSFYDAQRRWERSSARLSAPRMARNDLLIAPTVTSYAGRFVHLPEYKPEYAPVVTYLRFLLSEELVSKRGFYRSDASFDISTNVLRLRAWCGASGVVPFKIYDRLPKELSAFRPTERQLKGLHMGALKRLLGQLGGGSPHETMLKRLRLHNAGQTAETFQEFAEDILMNGRLSFENFAEILSAKRARSRNVVLTGRDEAEKVSRRVAGIEFGRPVICTL